MSKIFYTEQPTFFDKNVYAFIKKMIGYSKCDYRKVVCVLVQNQQMISYGVNKVLLCDKNCKDKENRLCEVIHAEIMALDSMNPNTRKRINKTTASAYINHYPCTNCQKVLSKYVSEIFLFDSTIFNDFNCSYYINKYGIELPIKIIITED
jgi:deoxycytidylate deaminase